MLFYGYDFTGLFCCCYDQLLIQRFDGVDVDDFCIDAVSGKFFCCFQSGAYAKSGCNDGQVLALTENNAFSELKFVVRSVVDDWCCQTSETKVNRSVVFISCFDACFCFDIICWVQDDHARNGSHQGDILVALMGCTVFSYGDSGMGCTDFYIQMRISDGVAYLLKSTACRKHGKGTCKRDDACGGKSGSDSHHITFCDTTVDVAVRICFFEHTGLGCCCKVSVEYDQIVMLCAKLNQCITIAFSCCNFLYF